MDTLTHALSGALVARVIAARGGPAPGVLPVPLTGRLGAPWDGLPGAPPVWQSVTVGFFAGAFPDIDIVAQAFGPVTYLTTHRGLTHALPMLPLWALLVAWVMAQVFASTRGRPGLWKSFYAVAAAGIGIHIAGDWITQFGTMLMLPFSDQRYGLGAVFIIDLTLTGAIVAGLALAALWPHRRWPAALGLVLASAWVAVGWTGKHEAIAAGVRALEIVVMPRPVSPFNWTVSVFDGEHYHMAHLNTRRREPLQTQASDHLLRRLSAPYLPESQAAWQRVARFGGADAPPWVEQAWAHERFGFFRWFAQTPALIEAGEVLDASGRRERCAWFRDLRFEFPGREEAPFRYGLCLLGPQGDNGADGEEVVVYRLNGAAREPV